MPVVAKYAYRFETDWTAPGTSQQAYQVLEDPLSYTRWWHRVWLQAKEVECGDERGVGRVVDYVTKGWLPYVLRWRAQTTVKEPGRRLEIEATGDFIGHGCWTFTENNGQVKAHYLWELNTGKKLITWLTPVLKPLFSWNHRWAMKRGEEGFREEMKKIAGGS